MKIISPRNRVEIVSHALFYERRDSPGGGFSFPCDAEGNIIGDECGTQEDRVAQASKLEAEGDKWFRPRIQSCYHHDVEPAVGECDDCGKHVALTYGLDNTCECGANYNMSGQRVRHSSACDYRGEPSGWFDYEAD